MVFQYKYFKIVLLIDFQKEYDDYTYANFSFYENTVDLNTQMISPIASNGFSYYTYALTGTFYEDGKLINKIEVTPKRPKDRVFSGVIYIVEDDWQIYGLDLKTTKLNNIPLIVYGAYKHKKFPKWRYENNYIKTNLEFVHNIL